MCICWCMHLDRKEANLTCWTRAMKMSVVLCPRWSSFLSWKNVVPVFLRCGCPNVKAVIRQLFWLQHCNMCSYGLSLSTDWYFCFFARAFQWFSKAKSSSVSTPRDLSGGARGGVTGGRGCVVTENAPCIEVSFCVGAVTAFGMQLWCCSNWCSLDTSL